MTRRSDLEPDDADAHHWREARSLEDLGALMARWLEGDISYQPAYQAAGPEPESDDLVVVLAALNRAGYVTTFSQPGEIDDGWYQRAAVAGFCEESTADRITEAILDTELIALVWLPLSVSECYQIPISREGRRQNTWAGDSLDIENIDHYYSADLSPEGLAALLGAFQVTIIDPRWGRNDLLWPTLLAALEVSGS